MILITGATGLVGSHLAFELIRSGHAVRALRRPDSRFEMIKKVFSLYSDNPEELFSKIEWVDGDILDIFSLEDAMEGAEEVYHCAALVSFLPEDKKRLIRINTEGTANVVNAALEKKIRKLCHVSSIAALGRPEHQSDLIDENLVWKPSKHNSAYAISKYGAEREVWRGTAEGLDAVIVNPSIVLGLAGPGMGSSRIFNTVRDGLKFYPPGKNGFVDVRDVARAMILLMESDIRNERFILNAENLEYKKLLGMMAVARGLALGFTSGHPVINVPLSFAWIGQGSIAGLPVPVIILAVVVLAADILLRKARALRQLYYVGGSQKAAKLSGINVNRVVFMTFMASGVFASMAGIISMARLTSGVPTAFVSVELRVIAACVIGGASLSGGEGTVLGALLGLIFMALVTNAMTMFGVSIYWEGVITGSILTAAVSVDMLSRRRLRKF